MFFSKATKDTNTEDHSTGWHNTGVYNTGVGNTGVGNIGWHNTGWYNTGDWNIGYRNTGYRNTGDHNTGNWNACDRETGHFNSKPSEKIRVFNKLCNLEDWENAKKPDFLFFGLTRWIEDESRTEKGHLLKVYGHKEAFKKSYDSLSSSEREIQTAQLKALPNFDAEVFYEISGIDLREAKVAGCKYNEYKSEIERLKARLKELEDKV